MVKVQKLLPKDSDDHLKADRRCSAVKTWDNDQQEGNFLILVAFDKGWTIVTLYTNRRINMVEERVSELEVTLVAITQCEEQREETKRLKQMNRAHEARESLTNV